MDVTEIMTAQSLARQYDQTSMAINLFYTEGTIIGSVILLSADQTQNATVDTRTYAFPQEVLNGLENMLWTQLQTLAEQLTAMGVTGLQQPRAREERKRAKR